jgi:dUTP pyrophosphatase
MKILVRRLDADLPLPVPAHDDDAGADLLARDRTVIPAGEWRVVPTGIAVAIPAGYVGLVAARSGLAARLGVGVLNGPGVIDPGYRGEVKVILVNHGPAEVSFERGERIAQLVVMPLATARLQEVEELPDSTRGAGGLGSTGR